MSDVSRVRLYFYASDENAGPPGPGEDGKLPSTENDEGPWSRFAPGTDVLIAAEGRWLWLAVELEGDGHHSPRLDQLRVDYNHNSLSHYLPEIYRTQTDGSDSLERFLALFESFYSDVEHQIDELGGWLDPDGVPEEWLVWLADWLAVELEDEWTPARKREAIRTAFQRYGLRGTVQGLCEALHVQTGVEARIIEPLLLSSWWQLPETDPEVYSLPDAGLGLTTRLAAAEPQGAVVGTSAVVDHSHLLRQEEYGMPLFEGVAYRFTVYIRKSQIPDEEKLVEVRRVIDREKPAHTIYNVCLVEPTLRLGIQSVIGVDTILGGAPPQPSQLGIGPPGADLVLEGGARIGEGGSIGDIRL